MTDKEDTNIEPEKNGRGAPTKYKEIYCEQVKKLCLLGATDKEIANFFDVCEDTIYEWKKEYPEFSESIKEGKIISDANVADKLYDRAIGATYKDEQAFKIKLPGGGEDVKVVKVERGAPPDTQAISLWLRNRRSGKHWKGEWRDKQDIVVGGDKENPVVVKKQLSDLSDEELATLGGIVTKNSESSVTS